MNAVIFEIMLIIIYLWQGKNRNKSGDELDLPDIRKLHFTLYGPPSSIYEHVECDCWREKADRLKGGAAGRGPLPPEVPIMSTESITNYPLSSLDEMESSAEAEGKTKMAFAKMLVPADLRDAFLFSDQDFVVQEDATDTNSVTASERVRSDSRGSVDSYFVAPGSPSRPGSISGVSPGDRVFFNRNSDHSGRPFDSRVGTPLSSTAGRGNESAENSVEGSLKSFSSDGPRGSLSQRQRGASEPSKESMVKRAHRAANDREKSKTVALTLSDQAAQLKLYS